MADSKQTGDDALRVSVLSEALPYIQHFAGRRIVVKYGGAAMAHAELRDAVFRILHSWLVWESSRWWSRGGPEINQWLKRLEIPAEFRDGLRVTEADTMDVVEMVLVGRVNKQIVNGLNRLGARAVGLSGSDGGLVEARPWGDGSHGLVGDVARVNPDVLEPLLERGYVPVISSVAATPEDGKAHNINADTVAGEIAASLEAEKLVLLTDTPGILRNRDDPASLIRQLRLSEARQLIHDGVVAGGMTPKSECCIRALAQGVAAAHIIDGRVPHALLLEVFTDAGIGTMVVGRG